MGKTNPLNSGLGRPSCGPLCHAARLGTAARLCWQVGHDLVLAAGCHSRWAVSAGGKPVLHSSQSIGAARPAARLNAVGSRLAGPAALQRCPAAAANGFRHHCGRVILNPQAFRKRVGDGHVAQAKRAASSLALGRRAVQGCERVQALRKSRSRPNPGTRRHGSPSLAAGTVSDHNRSSPLLRTGWPCVSGRRGRAQPVSGFSFAPHARCTTATASGASRS